MDVRLSKGLAAHLRAISDSPLLKDLTALLAAMTIAHSRFSVHSFIIQRIVGRSMYTRYLAIMRSLPFIGRCENYLSRAEAEAQGKQAFCKSWLYNGLRQKHGLGNISALVVPSGCLPNVYDSFTADGCFGFGC